MKKTQKKEEILNGDIREKVSIIDGRKFDKNSLNYRFLLSDVSDNTELLIIDDLRSDFDFTFFFPVENEIDKGGDLNFLINIERQGASKILLKIPYLIFTSCYLDPKWFKHGASFSNRFEVIEFPISQRRAI